MIPDAGVFTEVIADATEHARQRIVFVDDTPGSGASLIQEISRLFLILMLVALVLEAVLCLPRKASTEPGSSLTPGSPPQPRGVAA